MGTADLEGCICSREGGSRFLNLHLPYMLINFVCCPVSPRGIRNNAYASFSGVFEIILQIIFKIFFI